MLRPGPVARGGPIPRTRDVLQQGMVITIELGAYLPTMLTGERLEDNVAINDRGVEILIAADERRIT